MGNTKFVVGWVEVWVAWSPLFHLAFEVGAVLCDWALFCGVFSNSEFLVSKLNWIIGHLVGVRKLDGIGKKHTTAFLRRLVFMKRQWYFSSGMEIYGFKGYMYKAMIFCFVFFSKNFHKYFLLNVHKNLIRQRRWHYYF